MSMATPAFSYICRKSFTLLDGADRRHDRIAAFCSAVGAAGRGPAAALGALAASAAARTVGDPRKCSTGWARSSRAPKPTSTTRASRSSAEMLLPVPKLYGTLSPIFTPAHCDIGRCACPAAAAARSPRSKAPMAGAPASATRPNSRLVNDIPLASWWGKDYVPSERYQTFA